ncbi:hypothetical protein BDFB_003592, partial [Asbolus verrucosus]
SPKKIRQGSTKKTYTRSCFSSSKNNREYTKDINKIYIFTHIKQPLCKNCYLQIIFEDYNFVLTKCSEWKFCSPLFINWIEQLSLKKLAVSLSDLMMNLRNIIFNKMGQRLIVQSKHETFLMIA